MVICVSAGKQQLGCEHVSAASCNVPVTWGAVDDGYGITAFNTFRVSSSGDITISADMSKFIESSQGIDKFVWSSNFSTWRSNVSQTEMGYLDGTTSDIQTQMDTMG